MKIHVYCKGHANSRVHLLEGTVAYWYHKDGKEILVREESEAADTITLDEANFHCDGDVTKAGHDFGYYIQV